MVPGEGFEPPTFGLQNRCTTTVLTRRNGMFIKFSLALAEGLDATLVDFSLCHRPPDIGPYAEGPRRLQEEIQTCSCGEPKGIDISHREPEMKI